MSVTTHSIWSTLWWTPKVGHKVFPPGSTPSKEPQEVLSTEKGGGGMWQRKFGEHCIPLNTTPQRICNAHAPIREQDWHKDTSVTLFILAFPRSFKQEAYFLPASITSSPQKDGGRGCLGNKQRMLTYVTAFTSPAWPQPLGKERGREWRQERKHLTPFMAETDSWLDQVPHLLSPTPSQEDYCQIQWTTTSWHCREQSLLESLNKL